MKFNLFIAAMWTLIITGCVTMSDFKKSQEKLRASAAQKKVYSSPKEAAKAFSKSCLVPKENVWSMNLTEQDNIIQQDELGTLGYFQVLCLDSTGGASHLLVVGEHAGGGFGRAFFLMPRITVVDTSGTSRTANFISVKQNAWSGNLEGEVDLGVLKKQRYLLVVEGDNRTGEAGIGSYVQSTYGGGVFITTNIQMYSYPTGKTKIELKRK